MVTLSPPTSEIGVQFPEVGKLVKLLAVGREFAVQNLDQLYVLVSSAHKTMTCTVLNAT